MEKPRYNPFNLALKPAFVARLVEWLLGFSRLKAIYGSSVPNCPPAIFCQHVLDALDSKLEVSDEHASLHKLPPEGKPLLIVANHPLGGLEGVALSKLLLEHRSDLKVVTNQLLTKIPELAPIFIGVDILSKQADRKNLKSIREASTHLSNGGALLLFPAGKVAAKLQDGQSVDHPWNKFAGRLIRKAKADCLPIWVNSKNSSFFYKVAKFATLRTLMLPRELANKQGQNLSVLVGSLLPHKSFRFLSSDRDITDFLKLTVELLAPRFEAVTDIKSRFEVIDQAGNDPNDVQNKLDQLTDRIYYQKDNFQVYICDYSELGIIMNEIGRAREVTFRAAGEGTGNAIDVDQFDPHYRHLFVWDSEAKTIVGGYRVGHVKEIIQRHGIDALYGRTLYKFDEAYIETIGNPLEMGRSFIKREYQRHPLALDLLWKGIGRYVAKYPEFHTLFGAVSISNDHSKMARALIAESMIASFRAQQCYLDGVAPMVPLIVKGQRWTESMLQKFNHVSLINNLVGQCDPGRSLPTLLRHYLSLNGKFVCFSVNEVFNNSLDGLILVDLRETPSKYLNRYFGKEGAQNFLKKWGRLADKDSRRVAS